MEEKEQEQEQEQNCLDLSNYINTARWNFPIYLSVLSPDRVESVMNHITEKIPPAEQSDLKRRFNDLLLARQLEVIEEINERVEKRVLAEIDKLEREYRTVERRAIDLVIKIETMMLKKRPPIFESEIAQVA